MVHMKDLSQANIVEMLSWLPVKDIARASQACRAFWHASVDPCLWARLLERDYGLPKLMRAEGAREAYRELREGKERRLPFRGVVTDGGVDDARSGLEKYWVDAMFGGEEVPWQGFCSEEAADPVNCFGVLEDPTRKRVAEMTLELRERLVERCVEVTRLHSFRTSGGRRPTREQARKKLQRYPTSELKWIFLDLWNFMTHESLWQLLFCTCSDANLTNEMRLSQRIASQLEQDGIPEVDPGDIPSASLSTLPERDRTIVSDVDAADFPPRSCIVRRLSIARGGNYTCPVAAGAIFIAKSRIEGLPADGVRDALLELREDSAPREMEGGDEVGEVEARSAAGRLPPVRRKLEKRGPKQGGGVVLEFERQRSAAAELVCFFQFAKKSLSSAIDLEEARDVLSVDLSLPRFGNALFVKLLRPENLMEPLGDPHDHPNVDLNGLDAFGSLLPSHFERLYCLPP